MAMSLAIDGNMLRKIVDVVNYPSSCAPMANPAASVSKPGHVPSRSGLDTACAAAADARIWRVGGMMGRKEGHP